MTPQLVRIIILAYSTERYIERCNNSVIIQSYQYLDIVAMDNGSDDGTLQIIDGYKKKDSFRFLILQKPLWQRIWI